MLMLMAATMPLRMSAYYDAVAYVGVFVVLPAVVLDDFGYVLFEGSLVCASQGGVLSIDEGVVFFAVLLCVGEGYLDVFSAQVYDGIEGLVVHAV